MNTPKVIYLGENPITNEPESAWFHPRCYNGIAYYSEEHIREVAESLGMSGDAFIAQLNGISYAEWMKGGEE